MLECRREMKSLTRRKKVNRLLPGDTPIKEVITRSMTTGETTEDRGENEEAEEAEEAREVPE